MIKVSATTYKKYLIAKKFGIIPTEGSWRWAARKLRPMGSGYKGVTKQRTLEDIGAIPKETLDKVLRMSRKPGIQSKGTEVASDISKTHGQLGPYVGAAASAGFDQRIIPNITKTIHTHPYAGLSREFNKDPDGFLKKILAGSLPQASKKDINQIVSIQKKKLSKKMANEIIEMWESMKYRGKRVELVSKKDWEQRRRKVIEEVKSNIHTSPWEKNKEIMREGLKLVNKNKLRTVDPTLAGKAQESGAMNDVLSWSVYSPKGRHTILNPSNKLEGLHKITKAGRPNQGLRTVYMRRPK